MNNASYEQSEQYKDMAKQYETTAVSLRLRIGELKSQRKLNPFDDNKRLEERIAVLDAEYHHLVYTAAYLRENYTKSIATA